MSDFTLPNDWQKIALGDYVEVVRGASPRPKGDPKYFGGKINWISIKDVNSEKGKYLSTTREFVTEAGAEKSRLLPIGSLILSNSASVCIPKILKKEGCIHDGFVTFPNIERNFEVDYFYHLFNWMRPVVIQENKQGVTQVNLNTDIIRNFQLPIPPLAEQKVIADKLDALLAQVETTKARLERISDILKRFRQSVLAAAVSGRLTEGWRLKNQDIKDWSHVELSEAANIIDPHPSHRTPPAVDGGVPYIGIGDLRSDGSIDFENARKVSFDILKEHNERYCLKEGDFVFGKIGTLGKATILPIDINYTLSANVILIQPIENLAEPKYLQYFLSSPSTMDEIAIQANSTSQAAFGIKKMRTFKCRLPSKPEQTEIVRRVEQIFAFADTIEQNANAALERVNNLTQSILAKAFRGELTADWRTANPDLISGENSAAALLERIKAERTSITKTRTRR